MARSCNICGTGIDHKSARARHCSKHCYHQSDDYKAPRDRYTQSEKGQATLKRVAERQSDASRLRSEWRR